MHFEQININIIVYNTLMGFPFHSYMFFDLKNVSKILKFLFIFYFDVLQ